MKDEELVQKVKNGDIDAFEDIIHMYEKKVFSLIHQMLKSDEEIEDTAQEVFLKVYQNLDKFKGESSLYTWIYRITSNLCIDKLKKRREIIYLDEKLETDSGEIELQLPSNEKGQDKILEEKELKEKLENALEKMPPKLKLVIVLRDIKGLSYEEVAEITGIKLGTVKSQINRARLKLKKILEEDGTFLDYIESK